MNKKIEIINLLKGYQEDYELIEHDGAMQTVIDWFINCTPDYEVLDSPNGGIHAPISTVGNADEVLREQLSLMKEAQRKSYEGAQRFIDRCMNPGM